MLALFLAPGLALRPHTDQAQEIKYVFELCYEEISNTKYLSRHIHGEEVDEIERVKRDVNVETVENDIRYFYSTLFFAVQN